MLDAPTARTAPPLMALRRPRGRDSGRGSGAESLRSAGPVFPLRSAPGPGGRFANELPRAGSGRTHGRQVRASRLDPDDRQNSRGPPRGFCYRLS
jgi:hypothetical protein